MRCSGQPQYGLFVEGPLLGDLFLVTVDLATTSMPKGVRSFVTVAWVSETASPSVQRLVHSPTTGLAVRLSARHASWVRGSWSRSLLRNQPTRPYSGTVIRGCTVEGGVCGPAGIGPVGRGRQRVSLRRRERG
jgi:hypothetical protein